MVHAGYFVLTVLAQGFITWLVVRLVVDDHKATYRALVSRNAQDMKLLEAPIPAPKRTDSATRRVRLPDHEAEYLERPIRPIGL